MFKTPPFTASVILVGIASVAAAFILKETGVALMVEGLIENAAHAVGLPKAKLMAQMAPLLIPVGAMGLCLYAAYLIGANERVLGYAPHLEIPLYEAAVHAYGEVRRLKGAATPHSEMGAKKIDSVITWYCFALTMPRDDKKPLVDLYGCRVPSTQKEIVHVSNDTVFVVRDDNKVVLKDRSGYGEYHKLLVPKRQLKKAIRTIASWGGEKTLPRCELAAPARAGGPTVVLDNRRRHPVLT